MSARLNAMYAGLQRIQGGFANSWGQTYDVRRLSNTTNGSITNNSPIISGFTMSPWRETSKKEVENTFFDTLLFRGICDNRQLQIGDILTQTGSRNDGSIFTLAQMRDLHPNIFVRTEQAASLSRPRPTAGAASQQPGSGVIGTSGYAGFEKDNEQYLTLKNGSYAFSYDSSRPQASLQIGIQPLNRVRDGNVELPTALYREHYVIYIPMFPGDMLNELDRIRLPSMDSYEVAELFSSDTTGLSGYVCIVERINT